jgi:hypothetical protein
VVGVFGWQKMSADNYLYIDRKNRVWSCIASCTCRHKKHCLTCQKGVTIGKGKDFEDAFKIAEKAEDQAIEDGYYVEYGITRKLWCK